MAESIRIETPSAPLALALLERLTGFRSELVPAGGESYEVIVQVDGGNGRADHALLDSLDRVQAWLDGSSLASAEIHLNDRSYRLERREEIALPRRGGDVGVLAFEARTVPLGSGVQVVSATGEIDLHSAPQLEEALQSARSRHVVLDLTDAPFVDSTALKVIVAASNRFEEEGRSLLVVSGNRTVARALEVTGLERAIQIRASLAEAISDSLDGVFQIGG